MRNGLLLFMLVLFIGFAPVRAVEPTPTFSASVLATQAAYEAAVDALLVTDQLWTPIAPTPQPQPESAPTFWETLTPTDIQIYAQYAIIALLLLIVFKQNGKIADLIPQEFALAAVSSFAERAKETATLTDDRWASLLQMVVGVFYTKPTSPAEPPAPVLVPDAPVIAPPSGTTTTVTAYTTSNFTDVQSLFTALPAVPQAPDTATADAIARERMAALDDERLAG